MFIMFIMTKKIFFRKLNKKKYTYIIAVCVK